MALTCQALSSTFLEKGTQKRTNSFLFSFLRFWHFVPASFLPRSFRNFFFVPASFLGKRNTFLQCLVNQTMFIVWNYLNNLFVNQTLSYLVCVTKQICKIRILQSSWILFHTRKSIWNYRVFVSMWYFSTIRLNLQFLLKIGKIWLIWTTTFHLL